MVSHSEGFGRATDQITIRRGVGLDGRNSSRVNDVHDEFVSNGTRMYGTNDGINGDGAPGRVC